MQNMLNLLKSRFWQRQQQGLVECLHLWHQTSQEVSEICGQALYEQASIEGDIGVLLDRADRKLFQYRNDASDAKRHVGRYNRELARRLSDITGKVYELRNQTTRFLIRSQGPSPFGGAPDPNRRNEYFQRALAETGLKTREYKDSLDKEIQAFWLELEGIISLAENKTNTLH